MNTNKGTTITGRFIQQAAIGEEFAEIMYRRAAECGAATIIHDDVVFSDAESAVKFQRLIQIDFAEIERRVIGREAADAAALPRNHPMRFALLYGSGKSHKSGDPLSEMTGLQRLGRLLRELFGLPK